MNGAITELSAKIIRSAKISNRKIMGPSQYLFLKRINCQNSLKMEKREKKLMLSSFFYVILSPTGEESAFLSFWMLRFAQHDTTLPLVILSSAKGGTKNLYSSELKSFHSGLVDSIKLIFLLLNHPLICFSLAIALLTSSDIS